MNAVDDLLVRAAITPAERQVWACLDLHEWRNREDLAELASVTEQDADKACRRFLACGLLVARAAYPDFRYRLAATPIAAKSERARLLREKLQASAVGVDL